MPKYEWNDDHQAIEPIPGTYKYRSKWACFDCRTSFVRVRGVEEADDVVCPNCQQKATDMGYLFEAPPKRNKQAWRMMEILAENNLTFKKAASVAFLRRFTELGSPEKVQREIDAYYSSSRK